MSSSPPRRTARPVAPLRRVAAAVALGAAAVTVVLMIVILFQDFRAGLTTVVGVLVAGALLWQAALATGARRVLLVVAAVVVLAGVLAVLVAADLPVDVGILLVSSVLTVAGARLAFGHRGSAGGNWVAVPAPSRPVVMINPHSGDGTADRLDLAGEARSRGVTTVVLGPDDDLAALTRQAVADGADALGMAGGDGSMGVVAAVAAEHDLPFVCIPAGTRNHFALDLGVRRSDVVGALDAFTHGVESRVDLALVNERVFVNNASLGVYGEAVQDPGYRDSKVKTLMRSVGSTLGPDGGAPAMHFVDDAGKEYSSALVVLVSNNPYALRRMLGRSTRPSIDSGRLGIVVVGQSQTTSRIWDAPAFEVGLDQPAPVAIDGEAVTMDPPLRLTMRPRSLRVRISSDHPGVSPSGLLPPTARVLVPRLWSLALGR